jgi:hypothetical protein
MTEVLWPLDLIPSSQTWNIIGNAATFTSPLSGATRTYGRPGARIGCTMTFPMMRGQDRARLVAFINTLLDRSNRAWVPDFSTTRRGSFSTSELLTNNDFSNGTTGWTATGDAAISVTNRVMRVAWSKNTGAEANAYQTASVTAYRPYCARAMIGAKTYSGGNAAAYLGAPSPDAATTGGRLSKMAVVPSSSSATLYLYTAPSAAMAGDYTEFSWASISACGLVDGGGNLLTHSDQIDNAAWTKTRSSVSANGQTAPDGTATADFLIEDSTAASSHVAFQNVTVASSTADYCFAVALRAATRSWAFLSLGETTGGTSISAYINLATGAVGTTATGANWSGLRISVSNMGNDWLYVALVGRKTNAATTLTASIYLASGDGGVIYNGDGSSAIAVWRATVAQSSVPVRLTQSTSAAVSASSQTGPGIYVKGLPASTQGLLEAGDPVQIGGQINFLTARLDSDAAGRGYLQCGRPWLAATNDAPVIVHQPMCKMILATDTLDLDTGPGQFSPFQIELVEAIE